MGFPGSAAIKAYLGKHKSIASIEAGAISIAPWDRSTYRKVDLIRIDHDPTHDFLFKTLTSASIPCQIENEVAAIKYVRAKVSGIPTPDVIDYCTDPHNSWIALQKVPGVRISKVWQSTTKEQKWSIIDTLVDLYRLFNAITSLDAGPQRIGGFNLDMTLGRTVNVGKGSGRWDLMGYNRGPYEGVVEYVQSYIDKEILYYTTSGDIDMELFDYDDDDDDNSSISESTEASSAGSEAGHSCLEDFETISISSVIADLERDRETISSHDSYVHVPTEEERHQRQRNLDAFVLYLTDLKTTIRDRLDLKEVPCLTHNDLHGDNILVNDDFEIVAIYHWEMSGFYPLSLTYEEPDVTGDFTRYARDIHSRITTSSTEWCDAFSERYGIVKEPHPLVASCLEPINPMTVGAWEY